MRGDRFAVAVAHLEHGDVAGFSNADASPEEALHLGPGEEVRVHDLVGVARHEELAGP